MFFYARTARGDNRWQYKALYQYQDDGSFGVVVWERAAQPQAGKREFVPLLQERHPDQAGAEQAYRDLPYDEGELPAEIVDYIAEALGGGTLFRRLARDYERLAETLRGWHWLAFSVLMTAKTVELLRTAS